MIFYTGFSQALNFLGWVIAAACCVSVLYGLRQRDTTNEDALSVEVAALYNATARSVWAVGVCWVVFACACGYGGMLETWRYGGDMEVC
jgi:hypothetical protein